MKDAEASHFVLLGLTLLFDVVMNGYPVMLQRYNRVLLSARFPAMHAGEHAPLHRISP